MNDLPPIPAGAVLWRVDPTTGRAEALAFGQPHRRSRRRPRRLTPVVAIERGATETAPVGENQAVVEVSEGSTPVSRLTGVELAPSLASDSESSSSPQPGKTHSARLPLLLELSDFPPEAA